MKLEQQDMQIKERYARSYTNIIWRCIFHIHT